VVSEAPSTGWTPLGASGRALGVRVGVPRSDKEEAFLRLALTHALVMGGDAMVTVALAGSIFFTTNPDQARIKLILALVLTMAPFAVVAPFLGPAIDRSKGGRRAMIVGASVGRAVTCIYMATVLHSVLLYPCALVILILSKAHAVAKSSLVPAVVDSPGDLVKAGARLAVLAAIAGFAAGGPAAAVLKLAGAPWVLRLAAVVYAAGAVFALRTRPSPPAELDPADHVDEAVRSRGVSLAAWCQTAIRACSGFLTFAVAFVLRRSHAPTWWYGVIVAAALIGGFIGNIVGPSLRRLLAEERLLMAVLGLVTVSGLVAARLDSRPGLTILACAVGMADGVGQLAFDALVQRDGSEGARGRSFARFEASFQLAWVGAALLPVILPIPNWTACLMMAACTAVAAMAYVVGRRTARRSPLPPLPGTPPRAAPPAPTRGEAPTDPGIWAAVRDQTPPLGLPVVAEAPAPAPPGPRRNPGRSRS
jgi:MFS family permease